MPSNRINKIEEEIKRTLATIVRNDVKDDRLSDMASITNVKITPDLKYAKVYVSVIGDDKTRKNTIDALNHGAAFIRTRLSKTLSIRRVPELTFVLDDSVDYSIKISELLDKVKDDTKDSEDAIIDTAKIDD